MDPALTAIIAAVSSGVLAGSTDVAKDSVKDTYGRLRSWLIRQRPGSDEVAEALVEYERTVAEAELRLAERLEKAGVHADPKALELAKETLAAMPVTFGSVKNKNVDVVVMNAEQPIRLTINHGRRK